MLSMLLVTALAVAQYPAPAEKPAAQDTARARPTTTSVPAAGNRETTKARTPTTAAELKGEMRRLWSDHIALTHNYIVSAFANLGDTAQVAQRLMRNQDEIGDAVKPFYGDAAASRLAGMLRGHIQHAAHAVAALKGTQTAMGMQGQSQPGKEWNRDTTGAANRPYDSARPQPGQQRDTMHMGIGVAHQGQGDTVDVNQAVAMLRANADSIAAFLNSANPRNWSRATLQSALNMHLDLLLDAAKARARRDWSGSVAALDASHRQAQQIADVLADGIVKQFPNRFTSKTTAMHR